MERWELIMKGINSVTNYGKSGFGKMEQYCKHIIEDSMDNHFEIKYYQGDKLIETVKITDYFNS